MDLPANFSFSRNISKGQNGSSFQNSSLTPVVFASQVITWTAVTLLICAVGSINNCLVLFVTWPRPGDKSGVNLLIFHFIAANLLMCFIHTPIRIVMVQLRQAGFITSLNVCNYLQTLQSINYAVVNWADASLSINRCVALFLPHSYKAYSAARNNIIQICFIWVICTISVLPAAFNYGGAMSVLAIGHCSYRANVSSIFGAFVGFVTVGPYVLSGVSVVLILVKCQFMNKALGALHPGDQMGARIQRRIFLARMVVLTFLWAIFCNIPALAIGNFFPIIFLRFPPAILWIQTSITGQYAFSACIMLFSTARYLERLRAISSRKQIGPIGHGTSRGSHSQSTNHQRGRFVARLMDLSGLASVSRTMDGTDTDV